MKDWTTLKLRLVNTLEIPTLKGNKQHVKKNKNPATKNAPPAASLIRCSEVFQTN